MTLILDVEQLTLNIESSFPYSVKEVVLMGLYPKIGLFRFLKNTLKLMKLRAFRNYSIKVC